jgi:hypothetical protein
MLAVEKAFLILVFNDVWYTHTHTHTQCIVTLLVPEAFIDFNVHQVRKQNLTFFGIFIQACTHSCDQYEYYDIFILPLHTPAKPGANKFPKNVGTTSKSQALEGLT